MAPDVCDAEIDEIRAYLLELRTEVNNALDEFVRFDSDCPRRLSDAARYSVLSPGKRFRGVLSLISSELCGCERALAIPVVVALETVHAYSLIHDDLPSMDDDEMRRGQPTCHCQFDEATAILAGDALQAFAFETLATRISQPERAIRCVATLARAIGACGMVGGQSDDVQWSAAVCALGSQAVDLTTEVLEASWEGVEHGKTSSDLYRSASANFLRKVHRRKTGALIECAMRLGAIIGNATRTKEETLASFGRKLGQAFQIADDLLDEIGNSEKMGKCVKKDLSKGKLTYVSLFGVEQTRRILRETCSEALEVLVSSSDLWDPQSLSFKAACFLTDFVVRREK